MEHEIHIGDRRLSKSTADLKATAGAPKGALCELARGIANADGPDPRIDLCIYGAVSGRMSFNAALYLAGEPGLPLASIGHICEELGVPKFTADVMAAIPGENILVSEYSPNHRWWAAVQAVERDDGTMHHVIGWGHSEALARRAAALKSVAEKEPQAGVIDATDSATALPDRAGDQRWKFEF